MARAYLPITREHLERATAHVRSDARGEGRRRSRELVHAALTEARATVLDVAEALSIDERGAARALIGERPVDIGDVLAIARTGAGGVRLARAIMRELELEVETQARAAAAAPTGTHGR